MTVPFLSALKLVSVPRSAWQWAEVCAVTAIAIGLGHWAEPNDPYFTRASFPWIWIAPTMVGLRYGVWAAVVSAASVLAAWTVERFPASLAEAETLSSYFLGGCLLSMICGQFGNWWHGRISHAQEENLYLNERFDQLVRTHHILRLSYTQLEQHLLSKPLTLRDALKRLRGMMQRTGEELRPEQARPFMQLLGEYFQFEITALYIVANREVADSPLANLGPEFPLDRTDPLVQEALRTNRFCYLKPDALAESVPGQYLIVAPIQTGDGFILGWLTVSQVPLANFHHETFRMLKVFLGYFADSVQAIRLAGPLLQHFPDCPLEFAQEMTRLIRLQRDAGLGSHVVVYAGAAHPKQEEIIQQIAQATRAVDVVWRTKRGNLQLLCVLLPFTETKGLEGYLGRIQTLVRERFGMSCDEANVAVHSSALDKDDAVSLMTNLLARCHEV